MSATTQETLRFDSHLLEPIAYVDFSNIEKSGHPLNPILKQAEARSNQLRYSFNSANTPFSLHFKDAMDHPIVGHHGHHHSRHVEKLTKVAARAIYDANPDLVNGNKDALSDMSAMMLFPYFHDLDQQMGNVRNLNRVGNCA